MLRLLRLPLTLILARREREADCGDFANYTAFPGGVPGVFFRAFRKMGRFVTSGKQRLTGTSAPIRISY